MKMCRVCGYEADRLYVHHLIPKSEGGSNAETIGCCLTCSNQVHAIFNNKELAKMSLCELLDTEEIKKYVAWRKKHPGEHKVKMSKKVKKWKKGHR